MNRVVILLAAVTFGACGGKATPAKPAGDPPCRKVAHHVLDLLAPDPEVASTAKVINDLIVERCAGDRWSPDAQQCMLAAATPGEFGKCDELLTVPQRDALTKEFDDKMPRKPAPAAGSAAP
jgi:hypothetical protein